MEETNRLLTIIAKQLELMVEQLKVLDPNQPVNCYGENLVDAIQNGIARGKDGITTYRCT